VSRSSTRPPESRRQARRRTAGLPAPRTPLAGAVLTALLVVTAASPSAFFPSGPVVFAVSALALGYALLDGRLRTPHRTLVAFLSWMAVSVLWSETPGESVRGITITVSSALAGWFLTRQLERAQVYRSVATAAKILVVASWLVFLGAPGMGREQGDYHQGALLGVFVQRNAAAFALAVAVLTFAFLTQRGDEHLRRRYMGWSLLSFAALVATESSTGLAVTTVTLAAMLVALRAQRWSTRVKRGLVATGLAAAALIGLTLRDDVGSVASLLGRDSTLTGRTVIWDAIWPHLTARPWHGWGWAGLYNEESLVTREMWSDARFVFPHGHNAYLDVLLQTGIVGLVLLGLFCLRTVRAGMQQLLRGTDDGWAVWPLFVTLSLLLYGVSEQSFASYFGFLLLVMAGALLPDPESQGRGARSRTPRRRRSAPVPRSRAGVQDPSGEGLGEELRGEPVRQDRPAQTRRPRQ
jgi:exopolysaccharide production protein ExoQ